MRKLSSHRRTPAIVVMFAVFVGFAPAASAMAPPAAVIARGYTSTFSGAYLGETQLNTSNVNTSHFGKLFTRALDGDAYAQPLYVPGLMIAGKLHNVVFVATGHDSVYAYDADDPAASLPLWQVSLGTPDTTPDQDFGSRGGTYKDILGEVGIVGTPVIDLGTKTLYTVALTKENGVILHRLHALDLLTGAEKFGGPVEIRASVPGRAFSQGNGTTVTFVSQDQLQRPGLVLSKGVVYVAFGSYNVTYPFHGWLLGYDAETLQQKAVFNITPDMDGGGIWQSGQGLTVDEAGNLYFTTSPGDFDYATGGTSLSNSVLKLAPTTAAPGLELIDWFTPYNQADLTRDDLDIASTAPVLLPGTRLLVIVGKQGKLYVLNRDDMGHFNAQADTQIVQSFQVSPGPVFGTPAYWDGPGGPLVYVWPTEDRLKAFRFDPDTRQFQVRPAATVDLPATPFTGGILAISANGNTAHSGIVWASEPQTNAYQRRVPGILHAFDASNLSDELWNSTRSGSRDQVGYYAKFVPPLVANGRVYLPSFQDGSGNGDALVVYGLRQESRTMLRTLILIVTGLLLIGLAFTGYRMRHRSGQTKR